LKIFGIKRTIDGRNQRTTGSGYSKSSDSDKHWVWVFEKETQVQKELPIVGISSTSNNRRDSRKVGQHLVGK
jgi:hypothetical protein